jgi:hypothetical protein
MTPPKKIDSKSVLVIISYRRAHQLRTLKTVRKYGYTGPIRIVVSDDDPELDDYRALYGRDLVVFSRSAVDCDYCDSLPPSGPLAVRNWLFGWAREEGLTHFAVYDDDYIGLELHPFFRVLGLDLRRAMKVDGLDRLTAAMFRFLDDCPECVRCIAFGQSGDYQGGAGNRTPHVRRKSMNTFHFRTDRPVQFVARLNDDVSTYFINGLRGDVFLTFMPLGVKQTKTQVRQGGLTDDYLIHGTYAKSMYTVLQWPAHAQAEFLWSMSRVHHKIQVHSYPCILRPQ